ncbi:MAG: hypothetical protein ACJ74H_16375 [Thermoanaerobaculia bacterium]
MTIRKKDSNKVIERALIADADNPDAWEEPISVPASDAPRPSWHGRTNHLELAAKFHVLSVLHRLGAEATLTYAQPDNVDIAAVRQSGEAFTIDVKTLRGTTVWPVQRFSARKHHFVVFVCFHRELSDPHIVPDVYMWASERLKTFITLESANEISLETVASKLDPESAWDQFASNSND